ncbi:MAG: hypothetical protein V1716_05630 [Candidatus Uhrbacteria bacterium]
MPRAAGKTGIKPVVVHQRNPLVSAFLARLVDVSSGVLVSEGLTVPSLMPEEVEILLATISRVAEDDDWNEVGLRSAEAVIKDLVIRVYKFHGSVATGPDWEYTEDSLDEDLIGPSLDRWLAEFEACRQLWLSEHGGYQKNLTIFKRVGFQKAVLVALLVHGLRRAVEPSPSRLYEIEGGHGNPRHHQRPSIRLVGENR